MKRKINEKFVCLVLAFFTLLSCSKEKPPYNIPEGPTYVSAVINEEQWEAVEYEGTLNVIPERGQFFELSAAGSNYQLELSLLEFKSYNGIISEGPFEKTNIIFSLYMEDEEEDFLVKYKPVLTEEAEGPPFNINITASGNSSISGTFSGMIYRVFPEGDDDYPTSLTINNGVFNNFSFETNTVNIQ